MNAPSKRLLLLLMPLQACAMSGSQVRTGDTLATEDAITVCVDLARLSFECPDDFVDATLAIEASHADPQARQAMRTERLRRLRQERGESVDLLRDRCRAREAVLPRSVRARLDDCEQKAACSMKVECARPVLEAGLAH